MTDERIWISRFDLNESVAFEIQFERVLEKISEVGQLVSSEFVAIAGESEFHVFIVLGVADEARVFETPAIPIEQFLAFFRDRSRHSQVVISFVVIYIFSYYLINEENHLNY